MRDVDFMDEEVSVFKNIEDLIILIAIIVVIFLKLLGVIQISWFWLLCPIWGAGALILVALIVMSIAALICNLIDRIKEKKNERN